MRLGVNYVPSGNWFYEWFALDPVRVRDDMAAIAGLGADHVRVLPLWEALQPNRTLVSERALGDLDTVVAAAIDAGLTVSIDCLQGHLSSYDFLPSWLVTWHRRNLFADPGVVDAEARLVHTIAARYAGTPGVDGVGVGNEIIQFAAPRHPDPHAVSPAEAEAWVARMLEAAHEGAPQGCHTVSFDDDLLFDADHPFTPAAGLRGDMLTVHSWVFSRLGPALGAGHPRLTLFARYLLELVAAWGEALGTSAPLWLQEVGVPLTYVEREAAPEFLTATLDQAAAVPGLAKITWWCSHDVDRAHGDFPTVEYDLGLLDSRGRIKPVGEAFSAWARRMRAGECPAPSRASGTLAIPEPSEPGARQQMRADGPLFARWAEAIEAGSPLRLAVKGK